MKGIVTPTHGEDRRGIYIQRGIDEKERTKAKVRKEIQRIFE